ncbi:MAG: hypothetical protein ACR2HJ_02320 [Fimbriimonadales bacterium]
MVLTGARVVRAGGDKIDAFASLPSNLAAVRSLAGFAEGRRRFVAIQGASGWGKSHLLRAARDMAAARFHADVQFDSAEHWLNTGSAADRAKARLLILDDVDSALSRPRSRQMLQLELERRIRTNRPTLCALDIQRRSLRSLPLSSLWHFAPIAPPTPPERRAIVQQMCKNERLPLGDALQQLVATLVKGDGHSLLGALLRIKAVVPEWQDVISVHPLRVAGILHPYLADSAHFDLREIVVDSVTRTAGKDAARLIAVSVYILSESANLCEESIATYFGMRPGDVYRLRRGVSARLAGEDSALHAHLERSLGAVSCCLNQV